MRASHFILGVVAVLGAAQPALAGEAATSNARASYLDHCASCHGAGGEGADAARRANEHAPALFDLRTKYGAPLPRARLTHFVMLDTRPGHGRLCGDRPLASVPNLHWRAPFERMVVREALAYVEVLQRTAHE